MENLNSIYRLSHFLGLSMLIGGTLSSILLIRMKEAGMNSAKIAGKCLHLIAAPGLMLLMITGFLQAKFYNWAHFKGAGYMHLKITLALLLFMLMFLGIRANKKLLRENIDTGAFISLTKKRQSYFLAIIIISLIIMWLISFRPF